MPGQAVQVSKRVLVVACSERQIEPAEEAQEASHVPVSLAPDALNQVDKKIEAARVAQGIVVMMADWVVVDGSSAVSLIR